MIDQLNEVHASHCNDRPVDDQATYYKNQSKDDVNREPTVMET